MWIIIAHSAAFFAGAISVMILIFFLSKGRTPSSKARNLIGEARGHSGCLNCGDRWNWKKPHDIEYERKGDNRSGMFPLCDECFQKLPVDTIMDFCSQLLTEWIGFLPGEFPPGRACNMLRVMRENVEAEKAGDPA